METFLHLYKHNKIKRKYYKVCIRFDNQHEPASPALSFRRAVRIFLFDIDLPIVISVDLCLFCD